MIEKQIVINNLLINYYFVPAQNQTAPTVVFLHGWRSEGKVWMSIINHLPEYNIYTLDLPGFGKSQLPNKAFTVGDYAEILKEFLEKLGLSNIILVGHSFGGRVGTKLTIGKSVHLKKLVLVDAAGIRVEPKFRTFKIILAKFFKPVFIIPFMRPLRNRIYQAMGAEDYIATPELQETYLNIINEDLTPYLSEIGVPTLIVWGEDDKETPLDQGKRIHSLIRDSKFVILNHAGHFSFLDKPEEFVKILKEFINESV